MNKELKKTFFMCLLPVLLIISNIIGTKYTDVFNVVVGVDFVTYPFTFLCTLLIINLGDKKDAYRCLLVSSIIQLLICISYVLATSLGTQSMITDQATYVDILFKVNETKILASLLAFIVSHCTLIYLYDSFKKFGKELSGLVIGLLSAMVVNTIIYLVITLSDYDPLIVIDMMLGNIIISIFMVIIITILFYILKEKELEYANITKMNTEVKNDKSALELIEEKNIKTKTNKNKTNNKPKNNNTRKNYNNSNKKVNKNEKKTTEKKSNKSKVIKK